MDSTQTTQTKLDLIEWIASLDRPEWVNRLWQLKETLQQEQGTAGKEKVKRVRRGLGLYEGKIVMSEDFDEPLEDFQNYM